MQQKKINTFYDISKFFEMHQLVHNFFDNTVIIYGFRLVNFDF